MPHVTIEYVIMVPVLLMQVFLFPLAAAWLMNIWIDSRRTLAVQEVAGHLGSTIQQLYFSLNHGTMSSGKATYSPGLPPYIEDCPYYANGTLRSVSSQQGAAKVLDLMVRLISTKISVTTTVMLGYNVQWQASTFMSNSTHAAVSALKLADGNITLYFGE